MQAMTGTTTPLGKDLSCFSSLCLCL